MFARRSTEMCALSVVRLANKSSKARTKRSCLCSSDVLVRRVYAVLLFARRTTELSLFMSDTLMEAPAAAAGSSTVGGAAMSGVGGGAAAEGGGGGDGGRTGVGLEVEGVVAAVVDPAGPMRVAH